MLAAEAGNYCFGTSPNLGDTEEFFEDEGEGEDDS